MPRILMPPNARAALEAWRDSRLDECIASNDDVSPWDEDFEPYAYVPSAYDADALAYLAVSPNRDAHADNVGEQGTINDRFVYAFAEDLRARWQERVPQPAPVERPRGAEPREARGAEVATTADPTDTE